MLVRRPAPLRIPLQARRVCDAELSGQVLHDLPRHGERVLAQEPADVPDPADLLRHTQPVPVRTPQRDYFAETGLPLAAVTTCTLVLFVEWAWLQPGPDCAGTTAS